MSTLDLTSAVVAPYGTVELPASKSISNRVLIISALAENDCDIRNVAKCDDTDVMVRILNSNDSSFNVGHAGTAMRFLTAFLARTCGVWDITGSERMQQRPIKVLVEALNALGAKVSYAGNEGYPPLHIEGQYLKGGTLTVPASISSQYVSALMLIAPCMAEGLTLRLDGKIVSQTYIDMTVSLMRYFGAKVNTDVAGEVSIAPGGYECKTYKVEPDWSAASYFFESIAIAKGGTIVLTDIREESVQGDAAQWAVWRKLGVLTAFEEQGAVLTYSDTAVVNLLEQDFCTMPDLVPGFAVACCMRGVPFRFTGIETLRIKECDRVAALQCELGKLGYVLEADATTLWWNGATKEREEEIEISTYDDHRMAMAFAPVVFADVALSVCESEVVTKSFPEYWREFIRIGGEVEEKTECL
ncbi:MAG: 3-phosphoshikimate 1-carboxyvinyltransferase [Marinifilaceae bacterium]